MAQVAQGRGSGPPDQTESDRPPGLQLHRHSGLPPPPHALRSRSSARSTAFTQPRKSRLSVWNGSHTLPDEAPTKVDYDALSSGLIQEVKGSTLMETSKLSRVMLFRTPLTKLPLFIYCIFLAVLLCTAAAFTLYDTFGSSPTWSGVPAYIWFWYFSMLVAALFPCLVCAKLVGFLLKRMSRSTIILYYLYGMTRSLTFLLIAVFFFLTYEVVLFEASGTGEDVLDYVAVWAIVMAVTRIPFILLVKWVVSNHRKLDFFVQITQARLKEEVVQKLWAWTVRERQKDKQTHIKFDNLHQRVLEEELNIEAAIADSSSLLPATLLSDVSRIGVQRRASLELRGLERKLLKKQPLKLKMAGKATKKIMTREDMEKAAKKIFKMVSRGRSVVLRRDFMPVFEEFTALAFSLFDKNGDGVVSQEEFIDSVCEFICDRENLAATLHDRESISLIVWRVFEAFFWAFALVLALLIVGVDIFQQVIPFVGVLLAASFLFSSTMAQVMESFFFVYFGHPYDVGDFISLDGEIMMVVAKINFLTTVVYYTDGRQQIFSNSKLFHEHIFNFRRSREVAYFIPVHCDMYTPIDKLDMLWQRIREYMRQNSDTWVVEHFSPCALCIDDARRTTVGLWCRQRLVNWGNLKRYENKSDLVFFIHRAMSELGISLRPESMDVGLQHTQPVQPWNAAWWSDVRAGPAGPDLGPASIAREGHVQPAR